LATLLLSTTLFAQSYLEMKKEVYSVYKSGDKERAFTMVNAFITQNPKDTKAQNLSAVLYYWSGENKKAKMILEKIVSKTDFPEAQKLLTHINKKLGKVSKRKKTSYKTVQKENVKSQATDLEYLVSKVADNPQDIQNRVLLSKFYFKIQEFQKAYDLAHEVLTIDSKNKKMQTIVTHLESKYKLSYSGAIDEESVVDKQKAKQMLTKLHREKKYNSYFNLYEALNDAHVAFTEKEYVDVLHVAIMLKKYKVAQSIIAKGVLPVNKYTLNVQLLLSKKLAQYEARK